MRKGVEKGTMGIQSVEGVYTRSAKTAGDDSAMDSMEVQSTRGVRSLNSLGFSVMWAALSGRHCSRLSHALTLESGAGVSMRLIGGLHRSTSPRGCLPRAVVRQQCPRSEQWPIVSID